MQADTSGRAKARPTAWPGVAAFACASLLTTVPAGAQIHVLADVGRGGYPSFDPGVIEVSGTMFGGLVGTQVTNHVVLEGTVDRMNYHRDDWIGWNGSVTTVLGRVAYMVSAPTRPARIFFAAATGYIRDELQYPSSPSGTGPMRGQLKRAAVFGGASGVEIKMPSRLFVRPQVGVLFGYTNIYVRGTIGFGLRF